MGEILIRPQIESGHLDIKTKNFFQLRLMRAMSAKEKMTPDEWVEKYAKRVSELTENDPEIRPLVEANDEEGWQKAIELIKEKLKLE